MQDNDGRKIAGYLPRMKFDSETKVVQVIDESNGEILYTVRAKSGFRPPVYKAGTYTVKTGDDRPDGDVSQGIKSEAL